MAWLVAAGVSTALSIAVAPVVLVAVLFGSVAMLVRGRWWAVAATAIGLGVLGQQKLSDASLGAAFAILCAFGGMGWRGALALALASAATWAAVWVALGQDLLNVPIHITNSLDIILGYGGAMGSRSVDFLWQLAAAAVVVTLLVLQGSRGWTTAEQTAAVHAPRRDRIGMLPGGASRLHAP